MGWGKRETHYQVPVAFNLQCLVRMSFRMGREVLRACSAECCTLFGQFSIQVMTLIRKTHMRKTEIRRMCSWNFYDRALLGGYR